MCLRWRCLTSGISLKASSCFSMSTEVMSCTSDVVSMSLLGSCTCGKKKKHGHGHVMVIRRRHAIAALGLIPSNLGHEKVWGKDGGKVRQRHLVDVCVQADVMKKVAVWGQGEGGGGRS